MGRVPPSRLPAVCEGDLFSKSGPPGVEGLGIDEVGWPV
jgi:hypothetical protein